MMKQRQRPKTQSEIAFINGSKDWQDSIEDTELLIRKQQNREPTTEKAIEDGDTLQSLSLHYHCPVSELKRLNNIHRDNEIYAKRTIKVPLRPFSMNLASVHLSGTTTPVDITAQELHHLDPNSLTTKLTENVNLPFSNTNGDTEVNQIIFNSDVKPIVTNGCDNLIASDDNDDEDVELLQGVSSAPVVSVVNRLSCNGADADISWITLLICIVIVIFAIPLIYVFYIAEHLENYQHHNHT